MTDLVYYSETCARCHTEYGQGSCPRCTIRCPECKTHVFKDVFIQEEGMCDTCADGFFRCEQCGRIIPDDSESDFCSDQCKDQHNVDFSLCKSCGAEMDDDGMCTECSEGEVKAERCSSCGDPVLAPHATLTDDGDFICSRCPQSDFNVSLCYRCTKPHNSNRSAKTLTMCNPCIEEYTLTVGKMVNLKRKRIQAPEERPSKEARTGDGPQTADPVGSIHASEDGERGGLESVSRPPSSSDYTVASGSGSQQLPSVSE